MFSGVPQGSVLGPLLFLVYINDLPDEVHSKMKLFADDSSLFAKVTDVNLVHDQITNDLNTITKWAHQWKMKFNPDITKQAIEVIFSHKHNKPLHPPLNFNNIPVAREKSSTHLGMILDNRLTFRDHVHKAIEKANSGLALMKYLSAFVSRQVLDTTYKLYVRPHLDYGDVIYHDQLQDMMRSLESVQYKAALIVAGCWQGTNRLRLYNELGWESLEDRRIFRRFVLFFKIRNNETPDYLKAHIKELPNENNMTNRYKKSFFVFCQRNWEHLDDKIKQSTSIIEFKRTYLQKTGIRPLKKDLYNVSDKYGLCLLTKLRVNFSDLRQHRFNHNFNCPSPICKCGIGNETSEHFLLHCSRFIIQRRVLIDSIKNILYSDGNNEHIDISSELLLYGSSRYNSISNKLLLEASIRYIKMSQRFQTIEAYD